MSDDWETHDWEAHPWLHVYGQYSWHGQATLRGTANGLIALRDAITAALDAGEARATVIAHDGEGYRVVVQKVNLHAALGTPEYLCELEHEMGKREAMRIAKIKAGA